MILNRFVKFSATHKGQTSEFLRFKGSVNSKRNREENGLSQG